MLPQIDFSTYFGLLQKIILLKILIIPVYDSSEQICLKQLLLVIIVVMLAVKGTGMTQEWT